MNIVLPRIFALVAEHLYVRDLSKIAEFRRMYEEHEVSFCEYVSLARGLIRDEIEEQETSKSDPVQAEARARWDFFSDKYNVAYEAGIDQEWDAAEEALSTWSIEKETAFLEEFAPEIAEIARCNWTAYRELSRCGRKSLMSDPSVIDSFAMVMPERYKITCEKLKAA